jgi:hypothetical protein
MIEETCRLLVEGKLSVPTDVPVWSGSILRPAPPRQIMSFAMMSASEIRSFTWLNGEARQAVMDAFNAVSQWRNEISLANDRYLTKVIDRVVAAQRAQGWPNSVTVATREHLLRAAKVQTQMIDQSMDDWQHQLKSKATSLDPSMVRMTSDPMSEMMRLGEMTLVTQPPGSSCRSREEPAICSTRANGGEQCQAAGSGQPPSEPPRAGSARAAGVGSVSIPS